MIVVACEISGGDKLFFEPGRTLYYVTFNSRRRCTAIDLRVFVAHAVRDST